jgi:uncharacterized glyoxalase superfamily protein PhnB
MKPAPKGWPRISSSVVYEDAKTAITWLSKTFGFEVKVLVEGEGGRVEHSELLYGDGLIMIGSGRADRGWRQSPKSIGGANTQTMMVFVDDADAHAAHAKAAGATIAKEPTTQDYGEGYWVDRGYEAIDLEGHHWYFVQRLEEKGG